MRTLLLAFSTVLAVGCAAPERSRNLANPAVPATTLAQQVCANCHGRGGNSVSPNFPNLAGQTEPYLVAQLEAFRGRQRQDPAGFEYMWGLSRSLSDGQIRGLAAYYHAQTLRPQPVEAEPQRAAAGRAIFESGLPDKSVPPCASCHGPHGQGNAGFPRIAGQHADYVVKQLVVFQRTNDRPEGAVMKVVAHSLSAQDIGDVAAYLETLPGR